MTIKNDLLKHKVFLLRYAGTLSNDLQDDLKKASSVAVKALKDKPNGLSKKELDSLHKKLLNLISDTEQQLEVLNELALYEARFVARTLENRGFVKEATIPTDEQLSKALRKRSMGVKADKNKKSIKATYTQFINQKVKEIVQVIGDLSVRGV